MKKIVRPMSPIAKHRYFVIEHTMNELLAATRSVLNGNLTKSEKLQILEQTQEGMLRALEDLRSDLDSA